MNTKHERDEQELALLLDRSDGGVARMDAEHRLADDPAFQRAFEDLQGAACVLEELGAAFHAQIGEIDIVDDVIDAVSHLAWEALEGESRPFYGVEQRLEDVSRAWLDQVPSVDLLDTIVEYATVSEQSDAEVELSFAALSGALSALGEEMASLSPSVDLVDSVMEKLPLAPPVNVVPLRARPSATKPVVVSTRRKGLWYIGWAAAAMLCVAGAWWVYQEKTSPISDDQIASQGTSAPAPIATNGDDAEFAPVDEGDSMRLAEKNHEDDTPSKPEERRRVAPDKAEPLTLQDAINARRRALVRDLDTFEQLASLSADDATRMLQEMDLSLEATLGAAQFLAPEEAAGVLREALAKDPDNVGLKYALARSLAGKPEYAAERQGYLEDLIVRDESNALPHYMLAADYMARGEMELGLDALSRGATLSEASSYTLDSMRQREAALRASGLDADVARYLSVTTAGEAEVGDIVSLRSDLLGYGVYYESLGDTDTAQQIYNAVNQLGVEIEAGAEMATVQQAGLETQQDAMYAIQGIAEILQQPENVALTGSIIGVLAQSILDVTQYIDAAQEVIDNPQATSVDWSVIIQQIFATGDRNIANLIGQ